MPDRLEEIEQRYQSHALDYDRPAISNPCYTAYRTGQFPGCGCDAGTDMEWFIEEVKRQRANSDHAVAVLHQALKEWGVKPAAQVWVRMAIAELEKANPK